jgi:TetR/AcrR family transcriptional repressor of bet genes
VLVALVQHLSARLEERRARKAEKARSAAARLSAFLEAWVETGPDADPDAVFAWVAIGSEAARDDEVRAVYMEAMRRSLAETATS